MSKFNELYNLIMEDLLKESTFENGDISKHTYVNDVINDIINDKRIKLGKNGTDEYEFSNLSLNDENELKEFLKNLNLNDISNEIKKLNKILMKISNNKIIWSKIYKGKYSGVNRKNSTNNASLTELIPCILFNFNELYNHEINEEFINQIINYIDNSKMDESFLGDDKLAALKTFKEINLNDKLAISKINSGKQCYKLIKDILKSRGIIFKNIFWCYRSKPSNVLSSNPSDVIILGKDKNGEEKYLGFSFKSGKFESEKSKGETKEPKLNSYVLTVLKMYDENVLKDFYIKFNEHMKNSNLSKLKKSKVNEHEEEQLSNFEPSINETLEDWKTYKKDNLVELSKVSLDDEIFRNAQSMIINFFINLFENDKERFKNFFVNKCLGVMSAEENVSFFKDGFYVLKGDERTYSNGKNAEAKIITPDINKYLKTKLDKIKIVKSEKSVQSFYVYFGEDKFMFSIRTSSGKSCAELPNLKFVCQ
jgi:hypothetical protein